MMFSMQRFGTHSRLASDSIMQSSERLDYRIEESLMLITIDLLGLILKYLEMAMTICLTLPGIDDQLRLVEVQ